MLFGKKKEKAEPAPQQSEEELLAAQRKEEEEKAKTLEGQLDFLRNPAHPDNVKAGAQAGEAAAAKEPVPAGQELPKAPLQPPKFNRFAPPPSTLAAARALNAKASGGENPETPLAPAVGAEPVPEPVPAPLPVPAAESVPVPPPVPAAEPVPAPPVPAAESVPVPPPVPAAEPVPVPSPVPAAESVPVPPPVPAAEHAPMPQPVKTETAPLPHGAVAPAITPPEEILHPNFTNRRGEVAPAVKPADADAAGAAAAQETAPIPNPLPTPKKHVPKEMDFDLEVPEADMHFDVVDMNGMDFFDVN